MYNMAGNGLTVLAARTAESGRTVAELSRTFSALTSVKAHAVTAHSCQRHRSHTFTRGS